MSISEVSLYKALKLKLGDDTASEFVTNEVRTELNNKTNTFLTKEDKIDLIEKINSLNEKMAKDKIDLIKWMFGFWISLVLLLLANWFLK